MKTKTIFTQSAIEAYRIACLTVRKGKGCALDEKCYLNCQKAQCFIAAVKSLSYNQKSKKNDSIRNYR